MKLTSTIITALCAIWLSSCSTPTSTEENVEEPPAQEEESTPQLTRGLPDTQEYSAILTWNEGTPYLLDCETGNRILLQDTTGMLERNLPIKGVEVGKTIYTKVRGIPAEGLGDSDPFVEEEILLLAVEEAQDDISVENCNICADFKGVGNEPGWSVSVYAPDSIVLQTEYGLVSQSFPYSFPTYQDGKWNFEILSDSRKDVLYIRFTDNECLDNMLGASSPYQVVVDYGDSHYEGCANKLN
ncbi:MAG: hypothetical protein AAF388_18085 [Bacteroidota bacterium]